MRLIIQFANLEDFQFQEGDILLSTKKFIDKSTFSGTKYAVSYFSFSEKIYLERLLEKEEEIYQLFEDNTYANNALKGGFNNFFNHIYGTCVRWTSAIDHLLEKYNFSEVILSDSVNNSSYLPYYEAEGEINRQLFYKAYDFIPNLLKKYLVEKHIQVSTFRKRSSILLGLRIFLRRLGLLHLKVTAIILRKLHFTFFKSSPNLSDSEDLKFIFLTRGTAHTHYMLPFVERYPKEAILHVSDGFVSGMNNLIFCSERTGLNYVPALKFMYWRDLLSEYLLFMKHFLLMTFAPEKVTKISGIHFNLGSCIKEMMSSWFDAKIHEKSVKRYLKTLQKNNNNTSLITGEMFTAFPLAIQQLAEKTDNRSLQLQTTLMMYKEQTNFVHCEKYLFKSLKDYDFYAQNKYLNSNQLAFWGSTGETKETLSCKEIKSIVFFTQPYENDHEKELVKVILNYCSINQIKLFIKLHPRDNKRKFDGLNNLNFIPANQALTDYITDFQLAILRTSSIGRELIEQGMPTIFCLTSESTKGTQAEYLDRSYSGVLFEFEQLISHLENYENLVRDFDLFRKDFLKDEKSLSHLSKSLNSFLETTAS